MSRSITRSAFRILAGLLTLVLAIGVLSIAKDQGWLSPVGIDSESRDSQVVKAIERTQEISLLSLQVEGIKEERRNAKVFGTSIPGSGEQVFLQYEFAAKLGIDGAKVAISKTGPTAYRIRIPAFQFIGYAKPTFKVAAEDGGVLSFTTPDIDKVEVVNEILNSNAQDVYLADNQAALQEQTKTFYNGLIASIDPAVTTTFEFRS